VSEYGSKGVLVRMMLEDEEWAAWSDAEIARHAGVCKSLVSLVRKSTTTAPDERLYIKALLRLRPPTFRGAPCGSRGN
jgi:hypothetical protein